MDSDKFKDIADKKIALSRLSDNELVEFCMKSNDFYRSGNPVISDSDYDFIFLSELRNRLPNHQFLNTIEVESSFGKNKLKLPQKMLSTDKAFSISEMQKWQERILKSAKNIDFNLDNIQIKATPKLDGFAAFDDGKILYTRGDGNIGTDISRVFSRGLQIFNDEKRGLGAGEIVVKKSYFDKFLKNNFEHSRNFQASIIREKELDSFGKKAIDSGATVFTPFASLPFTSYNLKQLFTNFTDIVEDTLTAVDFDIDGVIFEVVNPEIKQSMGANRKFHRWMIAFKENKEKAQVEVLKISPQVGRTGKITPVARLNPTKLSGAIISNVSCYHYNFIKINNLGTGSVVEIVRSGLVIPKIINVLTTGKVDIPQNCPSCDSKLKWVSDFLVCENHHHCDAQIKAKIIYFFATMANNDGFGSATIDKFFINNINTLSKIYALEIKDLQQMGFGDKTSFNLIHQLQKSQEISVEDYKFLAAFGVERLGIGNSENLLKNYKIDEIFDLNSLQIAEIDGFAEITAQAIVNGLTAIKDEFSNLLGLNFNLEKTIIVTQEYNNYFTGKKIIFTGSMKTSRSEMQKQAKSIGIVVRGSVSGKTDFLVIGDKVGRSKLEKAKKLGIKIITEDNYLEKLNIKA